MPRYFFHIENDVSHRDLQGIELSGLDAARDHAVACFADLLRESATAVWTAGLADAGDRRVGPDLLHPPLWRGDRRSRSKRPALTAAHAAA